MLNPKAVDDYDHLFKLILLGDGSVGKSNILLRYTKNQFRNESNMTMGIEYASKKLVLEEEQKNIKVQIWDTCGQDKYRAIIRAYYQGAVGALLVYDISNKQSYDNINKWHNEIKEYSVQSNMVTMLIGNKQDLESERQVKKEEARQWAENNKMAFCEVSAKNGVNIDFVFQNLVKEIYKIMQMKSETENLEQLNMKSQIDKNSLNLSSKLVNPEESEKNKIKKKNSQSCC